MKIHRSMELVGKNALIGGSSRGIGQAVALELAKRGASVTVMARSKSSLEDLIAAMDSSSGQKHGLICADYSDLDALGNAVRQRLEEHPVHILVNNTGGPPGGSIVDAKLEEFKSAFNNHLLANQLLSQLVIPGMQTMRYGRIINIISTSVKQPLNGLGVSNTIRGAVANWSKTLANELGAYGITVNNVLPGATATGRLTEIIQNKAKKSGQTEEEVAEKMKSIIPLGRFAQPEEIAFAIAFLASENASYISGINLPVDGGRTKSL